MIAKVAEHRMISTEETHFGGNPLSISRLIRKHQSTVSKAFSKFTLYRTVGSLFALQNDKNSLATKKDSIIDLPFTNVV